MQNLSFRRINALVIGVCLCCFISCKQDKKASEERTRYVIPDSLARLLAIDSVKMCGLVDALTLNGTVDFDQDKQVNIYPLVSGILENVKVQLGDYVQAGQVLGSIRSSEMAGYSNNLVVAQTNLANAQKQLDAQNDLFKSGLASDLDVAAAKTNYEQAAAQLEMTRRVLNINGNVTTGEYVIKSPISGFVVQKNATTNTSIRADNGNSIFTVSDLKDVWVQANVYESNISKVHTGDSVTVTTLAYPDRVFSGKIDKMMNVLDPSNRVMKLRIGLSNADYALKPQMFTSVTVINNERLKTLCVPTDAIIFDNSQHYVLVYHSPSDVRITKVEPISRLGGNTYVSSGVAAGDRVIASQAILIYDALNN